MDELLKEYQDYFAPEKVPEALVKLIQFEGNQKEWFAEGFELDCSGYVDQIGLKTYSDDPDFLKCFREFAQADGTGSTYAIWRQAGELDEAPIVAFGSEGGIQVVAKNLVELFRILTLDVEPMIDWKKVVYYKDEESDDASTRAAEFAKWLQKTFSVKPVAGMEEVETIVANAQKIHDKAFRTWLRRYYQ